MPGLIGHFHTKHPLPMWNCVCAVILKKKHSEIDQCVTIIWPLTDAYGAPGDLFDGLLSMHVSTGCEPVGGKRGKLSHCWQLWSDSTVQCVQVSEIF